MTQDIRTISIIAQGPAGPAGPKGDPGTGPSAAVTSVAGRTGNVTLTAADISGLAASATTDATNAANVTSGTLNNARLSGVALTANNLSDVASPSVARSSLGLGDASAVAHGSLALNGATLNSNALAVAGQAAFGGNLVVGTVANSPTLGNLTRAGTVNSPALLTHLAQDVFTGSGNLAGRTPLIGSGNWQASGSGTITVGGGYISATDNSYAFLSTGTVPYEVGGIFRNAGAAAACTIAILLNSASLADMVHMNFGPTAIAGLYWKTGLGSSLTPAQGVAPAFASLAADTDYAARMVVNGNIVDAWIEDMSGKVVGRASFYDPNFSSLLGPNVMWQLGGTSSRWSQVWARPMMGWNTSDTVQHNAGINGPIGRSAPAPASFSEAHVGAGAPAGIFSVRYAGNGDVPQIIGIGRAGNLIVTSDTSGFAADITVQNGAGGSAQMEYDGAYQHRLKSGSNYWLTKPNSGAPWFDGGMVGLGGNTSSYVAVKRSSQTLQVRLGDDSADAALQAGNLKATGSQIDFTGLPAADPHVAGRLWSNAGVVTVSAG